jgi:DNA-binding transcriptional regulator WhiA
MIAKEILIDLYFNQSLTQREIAEKYNLHTATIEKYFKHYNLKGRTRKYTLDESKISDSEPNMWYFLGLFCADGWMSKNSKTYNINISLTTKGGKQLIEDIKEFFKYSGPLYHYKKATRLTLTSQKLGEYILSKNIPIKDKTFGLDISKIPFKTESEFKHFLRGYYDGDGSLKISQNNSNGIIVPASVRILGANKETIYFIKNKLSEYLPYTGQINEVKTYFQFELYGIDKIIMFFEWLYSEKGLKLRGKYYLYRICKMMI